MEQWLPRLRTNKVTMVAKVTHKQSLTWTRFSVKLHINQMNAGLVWYKRRQEPLVAKVTHKRCHVTPVDENLQVTRPGFGPVDFKFYWLSDYTIWYGRHFDSLGIVCVTPERRARNSASILLFTSFISLEPALSPPGSSHFASICLI
uniref:Uncharacterized protein n=1 Tax=Cacopsylla melanoneura TaxID=428564 RepID=A0A8D8ST38_9HEMI